MYLWDYDYAEIMDALIDWVYARSVAVAGDMIANIGNMGFELLKIDFVQALIGFFSLLGWALFVTGLVVAVFEAGMDYACGRACFKDTALNAIKGFLAVSLFTTVPVRLFKLSINLQVLLIGDITGMGQREWNEILAMQLDPMLNAQTPADMMDVLGYVPETMSMGLFSIVAMIMVAYAFIKVFFASLKRGGILVIQIAVGSLHMFSVPRGYSDAFFGWCKQVVGLCLTSFLQGTILITGAMAMKTDSILGIGMMVSATEIPRIAGAFGLDTSMRVNVMGMVHGAQTAVNTIRTVVSK